MVKGIGTDLVYIPRIEKLFAEFGDKFLERILTPKEREIVNNLGPGQSVANHVAKRFAAKEAVAKALGSGIGEHLSFQDIEISNNEKGQPQVALKNNSQHIALSLSDEQDYALAFVVLTEVT